MTELEIGGFVLDLNWVAGWLFGVFCSAIILWIIGKKMQYDFAFKNLLIIISIASLLGNIPIIGLFVSWGAYLFFFWKLEQMPPYEVFWIGLIVFLIQSLAVMGGLFFIGTLMTHSPRDEVGSESSLGEKFSELIESVFKEAAQVEAEHVETNQLANVVAPDVVFPEDEPAVEVVEELSVGPESVSEEEVASVESVQLPEKWKKKYRFSGTGISHNKRVAIINGVMMHVGDSLFDDLVIYRIENDYVELRSGDNLYLVNLLW